MSFGDPNNPYGAPQGQQPGYPSQQPPGQPGYGAPQGQPGYGAPQGQPGYGYPQQAPQGVPPQQGYGYPQQPGGQYPQQQMYGGTPPYAHWGSRVLATLVDSLILLVAYLPAVIGALISETAAGIGGLITIVAMIGVVVWLLVQEGKTGQTIGKRTMGIRLLRESDGQPLGVGMAFVRRLAHFIDGAACYIGYLWPLWDDKKQTFADKVCSTVVIKG